MALHVALPDLQRTQPEPVRRHVHQLLHGERGLGHAVPPVCAGWNRVRPDRDTGETVRCMRVDGDQVAGQAVQHVRRVRHVGSGVQDGVHVSGDHPAHLVESHAQADLARRAHAPGGELLLAGVGEPHWAAQPQRKPRHEGFLIQVLLGPETAAFVVLPHPHGLAVQPEDADDQPADLGRTLRVGPQLDAARERNGRAGVRLEADMLGGVERERLRHCHRAPVQQAGHALVAQAHLPGDGPPRQRLVDAQHSGQHLPSHRHPSRGVPGGGTRPGDHHGDAVADMPRDARQEPSPHGLGEHRVRRDERGVESRARQVGRPEDPDGPGYGRPVGSADGHHPGVRVRAAHHSRPRAPGQAAVGEEGELPGHLGRSIRPTEVGTDPVHGSPVRRAASGTR